MKRIIPVLIIVLAILMPLVSATTHCPCGRPGKPGHNIKFVAKTGTTDNVSFYKDAEPELGNVLIIWAAKTINMEVLPIENLTITLSLDSKKIDEKVTDAEGGVGFEIEKPGRYEVLGGDADYVFNISSSENGTEELLPENGTLVNGSEEPVLDGSAEANNSASPTNGSDNNDGVVAGTKINKNKTKNSILDGSNWMVVAGAIAAAAAVFFLVKKCSPRRKSSGISGKRRG